MDIKIILSKITIRTGDNDNRVPYCEIHDIITKQMGFKLNHQQIHRVIGVLGFKKVHKKNGLVYLGIKLKDVEKTIKEYHFLNLIKVAFENGALNTLPEMILICGEGGINVLHDIENTIETIKKNPTSLELCF